MRPAAKRLIRVPALAGGLALASAWMAGWMTGTEAGWISALVLSRVAASLIFRLDRLAWRNLAFRDAAAAALACAGGSALAAAACAIPPGEWPARMLAADLAIYPCLVFGCAALAGLGRLRALARVEHPVRTLIWGAGTDGRALLERIRRHSPEIEVFGWLDDAPELGELDLDGVPVLGPLESLPLMVELHEVRAVMVAIPGLARERRAMAEELARWSGAKLVFLPSLPA